MHKRNILDEPYFAREPDCRGEGDDGYIGFGAGSDFNREIIEPGINDNYPDGVVGVRIDGDYWVVAILPYETYKDVSMQDIISEYWPEFTDVVCRPDSGDPWWDDVYWKRDYKDGEK